MKRHLFSCLVALAGGSVAAEEPPLLLDRDEDGFLEWISLEAYDSLPQDPRAMFDMALLEAESSPPSQCSTRALPKHERFGMDVPQRIAEGRNVATGRVTEERPGTYYGHLGTLYTIRIDEDFVSEDTIRQHGDIHVFAQVADFRIQNQRFCVTGGSKAPIPRIGQRVLVLLESRPALEGIWFELHPATIIPINAANAGIEVLSTESGRRLSFRGSKDLLAWIRALRRRGQGDQ